MRVLPCKHFDCIQECHSSLDISPFLILVFTTPPTPNAGTIRHIRAAALTVQFFLMIFHLSTQVTPFWPLLYRSNPSKCIGVLIICTEAGARNCAIVCPLRLFCISWLIFLLITGPSSGGTLKDAKIVRQSRSVKSA